jgi:hypothetical protein
MKMNAIIETRVGKINKVTACDWHLSCIQLERNRKSGPVSLRYVAILIVIL